MQLFEMVVLSISFISFPMLLFICLLGFTIIIKDKIKNLKRKVKKHE